MPLVLSHPTTSPTTTITLREAWVSLTNPQTTPVQHVHISQGGHSFVFSPGGATVVQNTVLPVAILNLHEDDEEGFSGYTTLRTFIITTLEWSKNFCRLVDPDGTAYASVRYAHGLESMTEGIQGLWSGTLTFRVEPA